MAAIIVGSGPQEGLFIPLAKAPAVIGRDERATLQIEDSRCSRKHVQIHFNAGTGTYMALDMKSTNGTYVNGKRIAEETPLSDGMEIQIGDTKLLFTAENPTDKANALAIFKKAGERHRSTLMR